MGVSMALEPTPDCIRVQPWDSAQHSSRSAWLSLVVRWLERAPHSVCATTSQETHRKKNKPMPAAPATPPNPSWIAIFIASVAFFTSVAGWFVVNWLAVNRENERDRKNRRLAFIRAASSLVTEIDLT